jgi:hypothetical protein
VGNRFEPPDIRVFYAGYQRRVGVRGQLKTIPVPNFSVVTFENSDVGDMV